MRVKIDVTARDIKIGNIRSITGCPVALALKRVVKRNPAIRVSPWDVNVHGADYLFPKKIERFHTDVFDGKPVKPFSFFLNLPKEILTPSVVRAAE